jgi:ATP:corrinoid adenosyltransferase
VDNKEQIGLIHLYCVRARAETTAAMGLITRAWGTCRVVLFQFLNSATPAS